MSTNTMPFMARRVQVIDGMKGPQHAAEAESSFEHPPINPIPAGTRLFRARGARYRLHMGKKRDLYDNTTQSKIPGYEFTAVFEDGTLRIPEFFRRYNVPEEHQEEFVKRLENHPSRNVYYWDVADLLRSSAEAEEQQVRAILDSRPALRDKLVAEAAGESGFQLPAKPSKATPEPEPEVQGLASHPQPPEDDTVSDDELAKQWSPSPPRKKKVAQIKRTR